MEIKPFRVFSRGNLKSFTGLNCVTVIHNEKAAAVVHKPMRFSDIG